MVLHDIRVVNNYLKKKSNVNWTLYFDDFTLFLLEHTLFQYGTLYTAEQYKEYVRNLDFKEWLPILKEENERYLATKYLYLLETREIFSIFLSFQETISMLSDKETTSILDYLKNKPVYPDWLLTLEKQLGCELLVELIKPYSSWNDASFLYPDNFQPAIHIYPNRKMVTMYKEKLPALYWQDKTMKDELQSKFNSVHYLLKFYDDWSVLGIENLPLAPLGVEITEYNFDSNYVTFFYDEIETLNAFGNKDWSEF